MDITSIKKNILPNTSFDFNGKKYFYNKITSYDTSLTISIKNGIYLKNEFINFDNIYCVECYFKIKFANEEIKISNFVYLHKTDYKNNVCQKSFLGIKYKKVDYTDEYSKILFKKGICDLRLKYLSENHSNTFYDWFLQKFNCYNVYNKTLSEFNKFKQSLLENNIE